MTSSAHWRDQSERGSPLLMQLITRLSLTLGRPIGRIILHPICLYFLLNGRASRQASKDYLRRALEREATLVDVYKHYHFYASTVLDRVFLLSRKYESLTIDIVGKSETDNMVGLDKPCLYLGAHIGSFEVMRVLGTDRGGHKINVLMNEANAKNIAAIVHKLAPNETMRIIPVGSINALLTAKNCVDRGERLALLGDRLGSDTRTVPATFFGEQVLLPAGPISLAMTLKIPVALFFGIYLGKNKYLVHLEPFIEPDRLTDTNRKIFVQENVERYAQRLEHYCRLSPYNWFNFFDFWNQGRPSPHGCASVAKP